MGYFGVVLVIVVLVNVEYWKTIDHTQIHRFLPFPPVPRPQLRGWGVLKQADKNKEVWPRKEVRQN